jgi:hypothetical protein
MVVGKSIASILDKKSAVIFSLPGIYPIFVENWPI